MAIRVNGELITDQAIEYELARLIRFYSGHLSETELTAQLGVLKDRARQQAIGTRLLVNETRRLDLRVPPQEIEERYQAMVRQAGGQQPFQALLKKQGLTDASVKASIEQGRKVDQLVAKVTADVAEPTEEELQAHFREHAQEYTVPERAQTQHILLRADPKQAADVNTARSRLLEIKSKIEEGADFADMAAAHSDCPSGRRSGGSLGWVARGTMVPDFDKAVFSLAVDTLSDIVQTPLGLHLIRKTAHEESRPAEFDEVREKIRDFLRHARRGEALAAYVAELRDKALIEEDVDVETE